MEALVYGSFVGLSVVALALHLLARAKDQRKHQQTVSNVEFLSFQRRFFVVYFLALLGDWLQGPYVYNLYNYYGYEEHEIAILYVAGFASSMAIGTFTGSWADLFGRKRIAMAYCVIYIFCCLTKLSPDYLVLLCGRIMGGVATSMLFSAFESWYVYEHVERNDFPSDWIPITFSVSTLCNGLIAIFAGVAANFSAEAMGFGPRAPFVMAVAPLAACFVIISITWKENFGDRKQKLLASCGRGLREILANEDVLMLGVLQTVIESCMYIFVFLWTPVMSPADPPYGMVFACFMVAIMMGSSLYSLMLSRGCTSAFALRVSLALLSASLAACSVLAVGDMTFVDIVVVYVAFVVFETAIGIYFPAMAHLKSQFVPEAYRANIMNWFRLPMNVITCLALLCLRIETVSDNKNYIFFACLLMALFGLVVVNRFLARNAKRYDANKAAAAGDSEKLLSSSATN